MYFAHFKLKQLKKKKFGNTQKEIAKKKEYFWNETKRKEKAYWKEKNEKIRSRFQIYSVNRMKEICDQSPKRE